MGQTLLIHYLYNSWGDHTGSKIICYDIESTHRISIYLPWYLPLLMGGSSYNGGNSPRSPASSMPSASQKTSGGLRQLGKLDAQVWMYFDGTLDDWMDLIFRFFRHHHFQDFLTLIFNVFCSKIPPGFLHNGCLGWYETPTFPFSARPHVAVPGAACRVGTWPWQPGHCDNRCNRWHIILEDLHIVAVECCLTLLGLPSGELT